MLFPSNMSSVSELLSSVWNVNYLVWNVVIYVVYLYSHGSSVFEPVPLCILYLFLLHILPPLCLPRSETSTRRPYHQVVFSPRWCKVGAFYDQVSQAVPPLKVSDFSALTRIIQPRVLYVAISVHQSVSYLSKHMAKESVNKQGCGAASALILFVFHGVMREAAMIVKFTTFLTIKPLPLLHFDFATLQCMFSEAQSACTFH